MPKEFNHGSGRLTIKKLTKNDLIGMKISVLSPFGSRGFHFCAGKTQF